MPIDYVKHKFSSPDLKKVVLEAVAFFENTPVQTLHSLEKFVGLGVYGLYYTGGYSIYSGFADPSFVQPIYVGKAVPAGWRTGRGSKSGSGLYSRLNQHAASIAHVVNAEGFRLEDFYCRFMILDDIEADLIVPVEAELIRKYAPLWNTVIDGFGNHDPGKGRYNQALSEWDILHPGRPWAEKLTNRARTLENILEKIRSYKK